MIKRFRLPDLGEGLTESEIVTWRVAEGDRVVLDQVLADVETAKAVVELPSPCTGVVEQLHVPAGTVVGVGSVLVTFRVDDSSSVGGDEPAAPRPSSPGASRETVEGGATDEPVADLQAQQHAVELAPPPPPPPPDVPANLVGYGAAAEGSAVPVRRPRRFPSTSGGAAAREARPPARPTWGTDGVERVPVRGVRRVSAAAMAASAAVPQVTLFTTVDVTPTVDLLMAQREADGRAPTFLAAVAHGLCLALRTHPEVNARWEGGTQEIVRIRAVHLGVAVATPRGLLVPVVGDADREDLAGLGRRILDVAQTARGGRSTTADLSGGTITVSNVGVFGVIAGTPLLHDGQAAIVAVGAVARRPCEWRDEVALRSTVTLSLTIDHRVLDGEQGARFLADLGRLLAEPALAFVR